ncbi:hypothetical protein J4233_03740 [Candidatus Pacearchaeota archaeon]|nr:hypothetical protein [Candidatus Pacearchaeota archaeon]
MAKKDFEEQILRRLDAVIALMLEPQTKEMNVKDKVERLYNLGLDYNQIATILNKTPGNIAVIINSLKKKDGKGTN